MGSSNVNRKSSHTCSMFPDSLLETLFPLTSCFWFSCLVCTLSHNRTEVHAASVAHVFVPWPNKSWTKQQNVTNKWKIALLWKKDAIYTQKNPFETPELDRAGSHMPLGNPNFDSNFLIVGNDCDKLISWFLKGDISWHLIFVILEILSKPSHFFFKLQKTWIGVANCPTTR